MASLGGRSDPFGGAFTTPVTTAGTVYRDGTKDYVFGVVGFNDLSGSNSPTTFMKGFGLRGSKVGDGNLDAHWASVSHQGTGEAGLFIGDVTAAAGGSAGNIWGQHLVLQDDVGAKMVGSRVEMASSVARPGGGKDAIGFQVRNTSDAVQLDQGVRITGNWSRPLIVYSDAAGTALVTDLDRFGALRTASTVSIFSPDGSGSTGMFLARQAALTTTPILGARAIGDTQDRVQVTADGRVNWAPGNGGATLANLYASSGTVRTDYSVQIEQNFALNGATSSVIARKAGATTQDTFVTRLATDTIDRLAIRADGRTTYSDGTNAPDAYSEWITGGVRFNGKLTTTAGLGVGNSTSDSTPGTLARKSQVFNSAGAALGFIYIYAS